jgi:hypothetical protein
MECETTMKTTITNATLALALCIASTFAQAQTYHLLSSMTVAGGDICTSATYKTFSTIGQPTAGRDSGGPYINGAGFWEGYEALQEHFSPNIPVNGGWNLLSVARAESDYRKSVLYPLSVSNAFEFVPGSGYVPRDTLSNGKGFWLKFASADTLIVSGLVRTIDTVDVQAGWNIVGGISVLVDTSAVTSDPPGIRASSWFGYAGAYLPSPLLLPGKGYWIKASAAGRFIFNASVDAPSRPVQREREDHIASVDEFILMEKDGAKQSLYIEVEASQAGAMSELPPQGPEGTFDARFASQKSIESAKSSGGQTIVIRSSSYPVTLAWNLKDVEAYVIKDGITGTVMQPKHISGQGELVITDPAITRLVLVKEQGVPHEFVLDQNYPNPFNPTTQIKFSVAMAGPATVEMFDVLGQKVKTLFNENAEPGRYYTLNVNGANMASGVYFYRLQSGARLDTRKMLLLK